MGDSSETPSRTVYNNPSLLHNTIKYLDDKRDVVSCMVTSQLGLAVGMNVLYHEVEDKVLNELIDRHCPFVRISR